MNVIFMELFIKIKTSDVIFQFTSWDNFSGQTLCVKRGGVNSAKEEDLVRWRDGDSCMVPPLLAEKGFYMTR